MLSTYLIHVIGLYDTLHDFLYHSSEVKGVIYLFIYLVIVAKVFALVMGYL